MLTKIITASQNLLPRVPLKEPEPGVMAKQLSEKLAEITLHYIAFTKTTLSQPFNN